MKIELEKTYSPHQIEKKWYEFWQNGKFFGDEPDSSKKPFCIVIPPPNVTGILHMGHALNETIQDVLVRWRRMQGFCALWVPGTDHAGIATQNVVEKKLAKDGLDRHTLGREKFIQEVWKWKGQYHDTIINQLKRLGNSCDWDRERFTMDDGLSDAVMEVFLRLYEKGLIYKSNYIINYCPRCQTALSDEEAQHETLDGILYYIKYPVKGSSDYVVVATTRPETMLGDTAVAVNPNDERYTEFHNKKIILPILYREIPIIKDELIDREFGTGAVKVTPAHDPNDFQMGIKHKLEFINVMHKDGTMNDNASSEFSGMDRFEAREALVDVLKQKGLLLKTEKHSHSVGHCYRCHTVIEPYLSKQWFVKMKPLAEPAIKASNNSDIEFFPPRWTKVYLNWLENIRDWCISRQIWWGHRIPVYYCEKCYEEKDLRTGEQISGKIKGMMVSKTKPLACSDCGGTQIRQDEDVLDTWFSSWLWPFSTLGWPQKTKDFEYFYPTSVLVTGQDIIFFWVARMIMAGLEFTSRVPFKHINIHGIVRDTSGAKMSKSLGNIIDPIEIIDEYGADALRFSLISLTSVGQDVYLSKDKFETGRNFSNKIWNATRFLLMNISDIESVDIDKIKTDLNLVDGWILQELNDLVFNVNDMMEKYRLNDASLTIYDFIWHKYCDWYLEMIKIDFLSADAKRKQTASLVAVYVLENALRLLHPIMPFITEEIWQTLKKIVKNQNTCGETIMRASWPVIKKDILLTGAKENISLLMDIIVSVRNIRAELNIPPVKKCKIQIQVAGEQKIKILKTLSPIIQQLARVDELVVDEYIAKEKKTVTIVLNGAIVNIPLSDIVDTEKEVARISKKIKDEENILDALNKRLSNRTFIEKAPEDIVLAQKKTREELSEKIKKMKALLEDIR